MHPRQGSERRMWRDHCAFILHHTPKGAHAHISSAPVHQTHPAPPTRHIFVHLSSNYDVPAYRHDLSIQISLHDHAAANAVDRFASDTRLDCDGSKIRILLRLRKVRESTQD